MVSKLIINEATHLGIFLEVCFFPKGQPKAGPSPCNGWREGWGVGGLEKPTAAETFGLLKNCDDHDCFIVQENHLHYETGG